MKISEIAKEINGYLKRFDADKSINKPNEAGLHDYYNANAYQGGRYVRVVYVSYQGAISLTKEQAMAYLEWLRAGNVGTHYKALG